MAAPSFWLTRSLPFLRTISLLMAVIGGAAVPVFSSSPCSTLHEVSLLQVERELKDALSNGMLPSSLPSLGGLTDVCGYRWNSALKDIQILGEIGDGPPILLDQFVTALRIGHYRAMGMTLLPQDPARSDSMQQVYAFPPQIADTLLVAPLTEADYHAKGEAYRHVAARYKEELRHCSASTMSSPQEQRVDARIFFLQAKPQLEFERDDLGFTVRIRRADVVLLAGGDLKAASDKSGDSRLPPGHPLGEFAADFTSRFVERERQEPVYKRLHTMYNLFLLAQLLRAETVPFDFRFWLSEYMLKPHPPQQPLPGFEPITLTETCWPYEYSGVRIVRRVWGGVIIAYQQYFPELLPDHTLVLPDAPDYIAASIAEHSAIQAIPSSPPGATPSLPGVSPQHLRDTVEVNVGGIEVSLPQSVLSRVLSAPTPPLSPAGGSGFPGPLGGPPTSGPSSPSSGLHPPLPTPPRVMAPEPSRAPRCRTVFGRLECY